MKKPLIILTGPTAVGKTALSINLAKAINGAVISADSVQVYRNLDIGSAKITPDEMRGVEHYLIDLYDADYDYNIATFKADSNVALEAIYEDKKIPLVTGGTGFYIHALLYDNDFTEESSSSETRVKLEKIADQDNGKDILFDKLKAIDPLSAERIHPNNVKRVIRAIEFYEENGFPISSYNDEQKEKESPYNYVYLVLDDDRDRLYDRINKRVDIMIEQGLVAEVKALIDAGIKRDAISMQSLGYRQIYNYLEGDCSLEQAIEDIKLETRHFAKRQLTWFRHEKDVIRIYKPDFNWDDEKILEFILKILKEKNIICN